MLTRSKLFSSVMDSMNNRKSNGSTAQCGGPSVVLLNLHHHIQSHGQCYPLATVRTLRQTDSSIQGGPQSQPTCSSEEKISTPPEMNSKCLVIQHICWVTLHLLCGSQHKEWLFPQILSKQKNMFLQMQNNVLSTIYMQFQVFLDVKPCISASSSWHYQVFDSWFSLQVSTPWSLAISGTTHPTAHHILLGLLDLQHEGTKILQYFLCFVYSASRHNCVKKNQLDAQLILSIFRQPLTCFGHI